MARRTRWEQRGDGESVDGLRRELQQVMEEHCGVFRTQAVLEEGLAKVRQLRARLDHAVLKDHSRIFNTARIEALELENLVELGLATVASALGRNESRGAHSRLDFPRYDDFWSRHNNVVTLEAGDMKVEPRPVVSVAELQPLVEARKAQGAAA